MVHVGSYPHFLQPPCSLSLLRLALVKSVAPDQGDPLQAWRLTDLNPLLPLKPSDSTSQHTHTAANFWDACPSEEGEWIGVGSKCFRLHLYEMSTFLSGVKLA